MRNLPSTLLILVIALAFSEACTGQPTVSNSDLNPAETEFRIMQLKETVLFGIESAKHWREDAFLVEADMDFAPADDDLDLQAFLGFNASREPNLWLLQEIRQGSNGQLVLGYQTEGTFEDPREKAEAIDLSALRLTPGEAIMLAMQHADLSESFLANVEWPASVELRRRDDYEFAGPITWSVSLISTGGRGSIHVYIDDSTGKIIGTRDYTK